MRLYRIALNIILTLFTTSILSSQESVHFAIIGDYGASGQPELDVSNLVKSWNPDFIITLGDNNYENGAISTIDLNIGQYYHQFIFPYTGSYGAGDTVNRFFPSLGNHDWNTAGAVPYLNYFTLPGNERYYDFVKGPVHFYSIDSDTHEADGTTSTSTQATWLMNAMAHSTEQWKIVYFHHAPYTSGTRHGSSLYMRWQFKQWGASAVLSGHEHIYERLTEDSLVYFINGLGGKSLYPIGAPIAGSQVQYIADYGAMLVDANDDSIQFQFITRTGTLIDTYTLHTPPSSSSTQFKSGWNLISLPLDVTDPRVISLFPTATSEVFSYDSSGYVIMDSLEPGVGYWLKFASDQNIQLFGSPIHQDTVDVAPGWNLIGSIDQTIPANAIVQEPADNILSKFFDYSGSYSNADSLRPGKGYWVKVNQAGKLILAPPTMRSKP